MFCPRCRAEYRSGYFECSDCRVPLVERLSEPDPDAGNLDALIRTSLWNPIAVSLAASLLREAGIPFFAMDQNVAARQESGNILGLWTVRVPRDRESEAREILEAVDEIK